MPATAAKKAPATRTEPRNPLVAGGVGRFSRAQMYHRRGLFEKLQKPFPKRKVDSKRGETFVEKKVGGEKNGGTRKVAVKEPKTVVKRNPKIPALRKSIVPGTVLILLTGPHRGKRVIFLKQMKKSGLLLITGPLKLNSTPMRRVAQAFVIATRTRIDVSGVQVPDTINDDYFKKAPKAAVKSKAGIFAEGTQSGGAVSEQKKKDQKTVDDQILVAIRKTPERKYLFGYLGSRFSIGKGQQPHAMVY